MLEDFVTGSASFYGQLIRSTDRIMKLDLRPLHLRARPHTRKLYADGRLFDWAVPFEFIVLSDSALAKAASHAKDLLRAVL